jgi:hypothetical protein
MRVELTAEVFTSAEHLHHVVTLVGHFISGRHEWIINPQTVHVAVAYFKENTPQQAQVYGQLVEKGIVSQAWSSRQPSRPTVQVTPAHIAEHLEDLGRAAQFVVENHLSDGAFLRALAHIFGEDDILRAAEKGWLEFAHGGGGGGVLTVAAEQHKRFKQVARVGLMLDSDRMFPGDAAKYDGRAAELQQIGVHVHVLELREVENYMPNRVLAAAASKRPKTMEKITHLRCLTHEQRGHFDMKRGFKAKHGDHAEVHVKQTELFAGIPDTVIVGLREGFGEGLTALMEREAKVGKIAETDFDSLGPTVRGELRALMTLLLQIV